MELFEGSDTKKCVPEGTHEKVYSFFLAQSAIVATQSLPEGTRKRGNTFYQGIISPTSIFRLCSTFIISLSVSKVNYLKKLNEKV